MDCQKIQLVLPTCLMHMQPIFYPFTCLSKLFVVTVGIYIISILFGVFFKTRIPAKIAAFNRAGDTKKLAQTEKVFGKYREGVKAGNAGVMLKCTGIVFSFNTLGGLMNTVMSVFILPLVLTLVYAGFSQGAAFTEIKKGSTRWSVFLYCIVGGLEWVTYPLANFAGLIMVTGFVMPIFTGVLIGGSLLNAIIDVGHVYCIIMAFFLIQAPLELLYVRKVLQSGGTGIPLEPY